MSWAHTIVGGRSIDMVECRENMQSFLPPYTLLLRKGDFGWEEALGMENSRAISRKVCPLLLPHRCIFSAARQAPHKAADIVHCPLAEVFRGCGLLPIHEESPHGAWFGGLVLLGLWPALSYAPTPVGWPFAQIVQRWTDKRVFFLPMDTLPKTPDGGGTGFPSTPWRNLKHGGGYAHLCGSRG